MDFKELTLLDVMKCKTISSDAAFGLYRATFEFISWFDSSDVIKSLKKSLNKAMQEVDNREFIYKLFNNECITDYFIDALKEFEPSVLVDVLNGYLEYEGPLDLGRALVNLAKIVRFLGEEFIVNRSLLTKLNYVLDIVLVIAIELDRELVANVLVKVEDQSKVSNIMEALNLAERLSKVYQLDSIYEFAELREDDTYHKFCKCFTSSALLDKMDWSAEFIIQEFAELSKRYKEKLAVI